MNSTLRIGIVGTGYIANIIADAIQLTDEATLVAIASRQQENAETFATKYKGANVFESWEELTASDEVDAVYVATPTAVREEICISAAEHKKHVLAEKPFLNLASLQRITSACKANGVAFMDGTHFPHHPRTQQLKQERESRIGILRSLQTCFYFPSNPAGNIRFDPGQEPAGAIGDMAWYSMRAVAEFMPENVNLISAQGFVKKDAETGAFIRGTGVLLMSDGSTATWDVGYDVGTCIMDLNLLGERGIIHLDDFVLDWMHGFPIKDSTHDVGFVERVGLVNPSGFVRVSTPSPYPPAVSMLQEFMSLTANPLGTEAMASIRITERTQSFLDAIWNNLQVGQ